MLSMTGFGKAEGNFNGKYAFSVEISSVNRKQLEVRCSLPLELSEFESAIRQTVGTFISRGAIGVKIVVSTGNSGTLHVNSDLLNELIRAVAAARKANGLSPEVQVESLMQLPGVFSCGSSGDDDREALKACVIETVKNAGAAFQAMRAREGEALKQELVTRSAGLEAMLRRIEPLAARVPEVARKRLYSKLAAEKLPVEPNDELFAREMLFYLDKSDVTEEITRLKSHFLQLKKFFDASEPTGRGLDFLLQEFFREITTLGNKAPSPELSVLVVSFKSELEKLREQVQNVE